MSDDRQCSKRIQSPCAKEHKHDGLCMDEFGFRLIELERLTEDLREQRAAGQELQNKKSDRIAALEAEVERLREYLNAVRPRPYTLNGELRWNPGTRRIWMEIEDYMAEGGA